MDVTIQLSQRNNTFIGNDFSKYMHINFTDVTAEFNQSQNNGSTFINTNTTALGVLNRTRTAWSVSNITFIDNWTTDVTVTYDIVGLTPNTKYSIYINGTIITYNVSSASGTIQPQSVVFPINIPKQITISTTLGNSLPNWAIGYYVAGGAALAGALYGAYRRRQRGSSMMIIYPELNIKFK